GGGLDHAHGTGRFAGQGTDRGKRVHSRDIPGLHGPTLLVRPRPLGAGVADHADISHAPLRGPSALSLLAHTRGVQLDIGTTPAAVVFVPRPHDRGPEGPAGLHVLRQSVAGIL